MVRNYRPDPVPGEVLERVVKVVHRAPSAGFSQGHRIVVVTDPAKRAELAAVAEPWYLEKGFPPWISQAGLPDDVALAGVITVGYPADDPGVPVAKLAKRRKPIDELVSWLR